MLLEYSSTHVKRDLGMRKETHERDLYIYKSFMQKSKETCVCEKRPGNEAYICINYVYVTVLSTAGLWMMVKYSSKNGKRNLHE